MEKNLHKKTIKLRGNQHKLPSLRKNTSKNVDTLFKAKSDQFDVVFRDRLSEESLVVFSDNHHQVELVPITDQLNIEPIREKNRITYPQMFGEDDLSYIITPRGIKEEIIVKTKRDVYKYEFELKLSHLTIDLEADGNCVFLDSDTKQAVFRMAKMVMFDANETSSEEITVTIDAENGKQVMTVIGDSTWINANHRVFPVVIDPQIEIISTDPITIVSSLGYNGGQQVESGGKIRIGRYKKTDPVESYMYNSLLINVNMSKFLELISDEKEFNCQLRLFHTAPTTAFINNPNGYTLRYDGKIKATIKPTTDGSITVNITNELKERIAMGSTSNLLFTLEHNSPLSTQIGPGSTSGMPIVSYTDDYMEVYTPNFVNENLQPELQIRYIGAGAINEDTPMMTLNNGRSGSFELNPFTSEYTHHHYDAIIHSGALKINLEHVYDSLFRMTDKGSSNALGLGKGWKTNLHQQLFKSKYFNNVTKGREVIYTDGNGKNHYLYEKWYFEINGQKIYDQVERDKIYLDSDNKLKINIDGTIHEVKYEVKSDDGLELMLSSSMTSYLDKKRFKLKRIFKLNYAGQLIDLIYNEDNNTVRVKVATANLTVFNVPNWGYEPFNDGTGILGDNIYYYQQFYKKPNVTNFNGSESWVNLDVPVLFDGISYYVNLKDFDLMEYRYQSGEIPTGVVITNYHKVLLDDSVQYIFDDTVELYDFFTNEDIENIDSQINGYKQAIDDLKFNVENTSKHYTNLQEELARQIQNRSRAKYSEMFSRQTIGLSYSGEESEDLKEKTLRNHKYDSHSAKVNYDNAVDNIQSQMIDLTANIKKLQDNLRKYEKELLNLEEKRDYLVTIQKESVNDFIIDKSGNIMGFDYDGRLILILDTHENKIEIVYKENTQQLTEIITNQGKTILRYSENGMLEYIVDEQGRKTKYVYDSLENLTKISYQIIDSEVFDTKFTYVNDQLSTILDASKVKIHMERNDEVQMIDLKQTTTANSISDSGISTGTEKVLSNYEIVYGSGLSLITNKEINLATRYTFDHKHRVTSIIGQHHDYESLSFAKYNNDLCELEISASNLEVVRTINLADNQIKTATQSYGMLSSIIKDQIKSDLLMLTVQFNDDDDLSGRTIILSADVHYEDGIKTYQFESPLIINNERVVALPIPIDKHNFTEISFIFRASTATPVKKVELLSASGSIYTYNDDDEMIKINSGLSTIEYLDYLEDKPLKIRSTDRYGKSVETILMYNTLNQETYREDSDGNITETYYNDRGQVIESSTYHKEAASDKSITRTTYDEVGNPTSLDGMLPSSDGTIHNTELSYLRDSATLAKTKSPNGLVTSFGHDFNTGMLLEKSASVNGYNNKTTYKYQFGLLTSLSHHGFTIRYELDGLGRKKKIIIGNQEMLSILYDDDCIVEGKKGTKVVSTYANGKVIEAVSDFEGKLQSIKTIVDNQVVENIIYTYDTLGRLLTETNQVNPTDKTTISYNQEDLVHSTISSFDSGDSVSNYYAYDEKQRLINHSFETPVKNRTIEYKYDEKDRLNESLSIFGKLEVSYDILNRINQQKVTTYQGVSISDEFTYLKADEQATNLIKKHVSKLDDHSQDVTTYDYDELGNIISIETDDSETRYTYDKLGRLIREDNKKLDKSFIINYDEGGNILFRKVYEYTLEKPLNKLETKEYVYKSEGWKDQLTAFNDKTIVYDEMGNPTTYKDQTLSWSKQGRLLSFDTNNYVYNKHGIRTKKIIDGVETKFFLNGTKILGSLTGANHLEVLYLGEKATGIAYNDTHYFFRRNIQGDVLSLHEANGDLVASYIYDAWGNHEVLNSNGTINTDLEFIGNINPIRYRGYYYDVETGLYYLNTRYYDPETGRFISADTLAILDETQADINGLNLYMYCGNNPVMRIDPSGMAWWHWVVGAVVAVGIIVLAVATAGAIIAAAPALAMYATAAATTYATAFGAGAVTALAFGSFAATVVSIGAAALAISTIAIGINEGVGILTGFNTLSTVMGEEVYKGFSLTVAMLGAGYIYAGMTMPYPKTGSNEPQNLKEQIVIEGAKKNPNSGFVLTKVKMQDPKMPGWLGWSKYQLSMPTSSGDNIVIHYVGNRYFPSWYPLSPWFDYKFVDRK